MPSCDFGLNSMPACPPQTLRSLVELSRADDEKLRLLKEAQGVLTAAQRVRPGSCYWCGVGSLVCGMQERILVAFNFGCLPCLARPPGPSHPAPTPPQGAYPPREAAWLVTSAWNRGCLHVRYSRHAEAVRFMHAALGLLRAGHCPELEAAQQVIAGGAGRDGFSGSGLTGWWGRALVPPNAAQHPAPVPWRAPPCSKLPSLYPPFPPCCLALQAMMEAELAATLAQGPPTPDEGPRRSGRTAAAAAAGGPPRA